MIVDRFGKVAHLMEAKSYAIQRYFCSLAVFKESGAVVQSFQILDRLVEIILFFVHQGHTISIMGLPLDLYDFQSDLCFHLHVLYFVKLTMRNILGSATPLLERNLRFDALDVVGQSSGKLQRKGRHFPRFATSLSLVKLFQYLRQNIDLGKVIWDFLFLGILPLDFVEKGLSTILELQRNFWVPINMPVVAQKFRGIFCWRWLSLEIIELFLDWSYKYIIVQLLVRLDSPRLGCLQLRFRLPGIFLRVLIHEPYHHIVLVLFLLLHDLLLVRQEQLLLLLSDFVRL